MRRFLALLACLGLAACAMPNVKAKELALPPDLYASLPPNLALMGHVGLRSAEVEKTDMHLFAPLTPTIYAIALRTAFKEAGYHAEHRETAPYQVDATLQQVTGNGVFDSNCTASAAYRVTRRKDAHILLDQQVVMPVTLGMFDVWDGDQRQRQCAIRAIRENMAHFINLLARMPT